MSAERDLLARLQQALTAADIEVDDLVEAALVQAREDVQATLRRLFTHDLLQRALASVEGGRTGRAPVPPPVDTATREVAAAGASDPEPARSEPASSEPASSEGASSEGASPQPQTAAPGGGVVTYLFGVVPAEGDELATAEPRLPGAGRVRHVDVGAVRAVVCDVDPTAFQQLRDPSADDLELLASAAYAHDALLTELASVGSVLPLRLGTVLADDTTLEHLLSRHQAALVAELGRLEGHAEWAVTVHLADGDSGAVAERARPAGPPSAEGASQTAAGRAYLQRRRAALDARDERWREREEVAAAVHGRLVALATDATIVDRRPLEGAAPPLLHSVYLLADERWPVFDEAIDELRSAHPAASIEVSGPWPAYHFTSVTLDAEDLVP